MKITALRAHQPATPGSPNDWRTSLGQIIVTVETDDGLRGIGVGGGGKAAIHVVQTVLAEVLVGRDPTNVERLHGEMCQHTAFYGRKGLVVMAISGIDLALWDLRGKLAGCPVAKLLRTDVDLDTPLPTYVTVFGPQETDEALAAGYLALKLHVERFGDRPDPADLENLFRRARAQVGPHVQLMLDAFARWDRTTTLNIAEQIAPHDVAWLEEPLPPDDLEGYRELMKKSPIPIAGGEHEYLMEGFRPLIEQRLHAILQPDINWCGGMTTMVQVYREAQTTQVRVCPHRGSEPYALHAMAALDGQPLAESPRKWFHLPGSPVEKDGHIRVPDRPGFGVGLS